MTRRPSKAPSQRQLRVGEELRHALAWILERGNIRDPELSTTPLTVTEVRVSPDLRHATAYVMRLGGGEMDTVLRALNRVAPYLRHEIARTVQLRFAPHLHFASDVSFDEAGRIERLLHSPEVAKDLARPAKTDQDDEG